MTPMQSVTLPDATSAASVAAYLTRPASDTRRANGHRSSPITTAVTHRRVAVITAC
jgi:hypothetical protein